MSLSQTVNSSSDAILATSVLPFNSSISSQQSMQATVATQYKILRQWTLCIIVILTVLGWYMAWLLLCILTRRKIVNKFRILFENLLIADALVLFSPMLAQFTYEVRDELKIVVLDVCKISKFTQTYSLTLSAYMLVALAFDSYNTVVKGLKKTPAVLYVMASHVMALWVSIFLYTFREFIFPEKNGSCLESIYMSLTPNAHGPRDIYMPFILAFMYIVPSILMLGLFTKLIIDVRARSQARPSNEKPAIAASRSLLNNMQMVFIMCMWYLLTNIPFILVQIINLFIEPKCVDSNMAILFEILSVVNRTFDPYIFVMYQYEKGCFKDLVVIGRTRMQRLSSFVSCRSTAEGPEGLNTPGTINFNSGGGCENSRHAGDSRMASTY